MVILYLNDFQEFMPEFFIFQRIEGLWANFIPGGAIFLVSVGQ